MPSHIYTRSGDGGQTGLYGGQRVSKDHMRVEAYGSIDELNAGLGWVRAQGLDPDLDPLVCVLQTCLFEVGAQVATPAGSRKTSLRYITWEDVRFLEAHIDRLETHLPPLKSFVLPTGTPAAAALHMARTICRRAERGFVRLYALHPEGLEAVGPWLNRLSDLLFIMARVANQRAGVAETLWQARPS